MSGLTEQDFQQLSSCIEIAHKVESQKLPMMQGAQLAVQLDQLRAKLKALVTPMPPTNGQMLKNKEETSARK